jgi:hypothetical protein
MHDFVAEVVFREPSDQELDLITTMLRPHFPGRDVLLRQLDGALVRRVDPDGSLKISVRLAERTEVTQSVPVMAFARDLDGMLIEFLLHVADGKLEEFEVLRADSGPLQHDVQPDELEVTTEIRWPPPS